MIEKPGLDAVAGPPSDIGPARSSVGSSRRTRADVDAEGQTMSAQGRQWTIFFVYTVWSVLLVIMTAPLVLALVVGPALAAALREDPLALGLLAAQAALGAWSARAALRSWAQGSAPTGRGRWDLPRVGTLSGRLWTVGVVALPSVALLVLLLASGASAWPLLVSLGLLAISTMLRLPWWYGLLTAIGLALLINVLDLAPDFGLPFGAVVVALIATVRSSLWLAAVVRELDDARTAQSQLAVAEERMRFARDLHDVTGRDLSAIAVKSELVAQLVEREDGRALEHSREVAQIARTSLAEIRALVRGYREVDLEAELQGTISLLRSARVEVTVEGTADAIPDRHDQVAAWVLREGGTNMLRHSDPSRVTIALEPGGIRLTNDGAPSGRAVTEGSGLTGLRERLDTASTLTTRLEDATFTLEVRFAGAAAAVTAPPQPEKRP